MQNCICYFKNITITNNIIHNLADNHGFPQFIYLYNFIKSFFNHLFDFYICTQ